MLLFKRKSEKRRPGALAKQIKPAPKRTAIVTNPKTSIKDGREIGSVLSGQQKRSLVRQKNKEKHRESIPRTAQQTIAYQNMFKDGICRVTGKLIPKERLRLVPHATLTVEAKEMLSKQGKN